MHNLEKSPGLEYYIIGLYMDIKITTVRAFEATKQVTRESILVSTKSEATQNGHAHAPLLAPL